MQDPMDDIARQARQGSVAAIIQILNHKLADARIRTRAVFADGMLQLLCEATMAEQLERSVVVNKIQQILEAIAPRNIRRVKINSRIVHEQQLLWLEEISRNPENLLWSEEIVLTKPNLFKQLQQAFKNDPALPNKSALPKVPSRKLRERSRFRRGLASGIGVSLLVLVAGWLLYERLAPQLNARTQSQVQNSTTTSQPESAPSPTPASVSSSDPFAEAVRLAIQADAAGKTAQTAAQWLDLAAQWEKASDLMGAIKPGHPRYETAKDRVLLYRQNSQLAQQQAIREQSQ
ncbi:MULTISPECIES: hypothetical protein [unclassified Coleofasciculus]|uniref:hypothetical protein n=1 Tax=unclassified Coleofasciculus TaxID=2692782 RepID=UPI00187E38E3|nr:MULTISPECIES: hypothetical protein [unclassified Coleofasciculus]MBE9129690.1 hypothetical protein [Coleofasciculus sp. LEGE 07081]MBE9152208.1 hypothetical protein [Coleofasciculus sp. LEGE 07092]